MRRRISGVLLLDKPVRISSNHALQAVKRIYRADKAGHAGTLDPLASGLLPVLLGEATRFSGYLLEADKQYEAEVRLGITTRTGDAEGEILEERPVRIENAHLADVLQGFLGSQTQVPPMYSALKRDGTPLYMLARRGETVDRAPRTIRIVELQQVAFDGQRLALRVTCSKGTYIRTLAEDIGVALGCGAHLSGLRRTGAASLAIGQATTLAALASMSEAERDALLRPVDGILEQLPRVELNEPSAARFCHGQALTLASAPSGICRAYGPSGCFLGLAQVGEEGLLTPKRLLGQGLERPPSG